MAFLQPQAIVSDYEREKGLRLLVTEALFSGGAAALTTGTILTAFALHLNASNAMIGVLASVPFASQLLQLPAILIVEKTRQRKVISVVTSVVGRLMLAVMAVTAFFSGTAALLVFIAAQIVLTGLGAIGSCAWNAWVRDLAPEDRLGGVFARRTVWLTAVNLALGLAAALALGLTGEESAARDWVFAGMFAIGCLTGMVSARMVAMMPEPLMAPQTGPLRLGALLRKPLADGNFRRLLAFVASWQFAVNLATPFFTVFIVRQLGFDVSFVMILSVVSQAANILALRFWGRLSDRFANKSVMAVCAPAYIVSIVAMIGASQLHARPAIEAWLVVLHIAMGISVAGVTLGSTNIALKLSPKGGATAYVAANALATAAAAGLAPILGGLLADFFAQRQFELLMRWSSPHGLLAFSIGVTHWDFYFLIAGVLGLYAIHRLSLVAEQGEIERHEMITHLLGETRRTIRNISSVAGLRVATNLPSSLLRDARRQRQKRIHQHDTRPASVRRRAADRNREDH